MSRDDPKRSPIDAPFPYFGGKSRIAHRVWDALGDVSNYIEPFFGSGAVLLARPHSPDVETVNDADGLLANFWRGIKSDPEAVAAHADWPVNEADLHTRHLWLVGRREKLTERLMGCPEWFDAKAAGWWVWGACAWIGGGWCSGEGPWIAMGGVITDSRQLPHLSDGGRGAFILDWFEALSARLRDVRICCGDWARVTRPSVLRPGGGVTGIFLDPPYGQSMRDECYAIETPVASDVMAWCAQNGDNPDLRIVLAGYDGEHNELEGLGWRVKSWKANGGYGSQGNGRGRDNAYLERLWLSPHCLGGYVNLFGEVV